jgi:hypothetical protein
MWNTGIGIWKVLPVQVMIHVYMFYIVLMILYSLHYGVTAFHATNVWLMVYNEYYSWIVGRGVTSVGLDY